METKQPFKALSKICLNNWHYIDRKILSFNERDQLLYRTFGQRKVYRD